VIRAVLRDAFRDALIAGAALLLVASLAAAEDAAERGAVESRLRVVVSEAPGTVRLTIALTEDVDPGSVEVQIEGRTIVVVARDAGGRPVRSRPLRPVQEAVEEGAEATWDADGRSLTITLTARRPGAP
jgi:hypothetical protein